MATVNNNTERTITKVNDGNDSFNAVNVETTELVEGGDLISETTETTSGGNHGGTDGTIVTRVYSDDVTTRKVNGEVRSIITRG